MKLMVVESPNKIKKLESILGSDWKVMASVGHIRDLPRNDLGIDRHNFKLNYEFIPPASIQGRTFPGGEERVNRIRKELRNAEMVYLATDPDREGEAIAWHLKEALGLTESKYLRITFDEITHGAVHGALAKPRKLDYELVHAQEARRALDRIYGYLVSPMVSDMLGMSLSAGRVQSPAVRLVVDQEKRIKSFKKTIHFGAVVVFDGEAWKAEWNTKPFIAEEKPYVLDEALATRAAACRHFRVIDSGNGQMKEPPPSPFSTSLLLQAASVSLKLDPEVTSRLAQRLFEQGAITYIRTDSVNFSEDAVREIRVFAQSQGWLLPEKPRRFKAKEDAQEAHEAIRPTHIEVREAGEDDQQRALYRLIWQRSVASQLADAKYQVNTVTLEATEGTETFEFKARGRKLIEPGWLVLTARDAVKDRSESDSEDNGQVPLLSIGSAKQADSGRLLRKETRPPPRFTKASLIAKLEVEGIGRPATYSSIMQNIMGKGYLLEVKRLLEPTETGVLLVDQLVNAGFAFMDFAFTRNLEEKLDVIASGKCSYINVVEPSFKQLQADMQALGSRGAVKPRFPCPKCQSGLRRYSPAGKSPFWCCTKVECKTFMDDADNRPVERKNFACHKCGTGLMRRYKRKTGKGYLWACSTEGCKHFMDDDNGQPVESPVHICPNCQSAPLRRYQRKDKETGRPKGGHGWFCTSQSCKTFLDDARGKPAKRAPRTSAEVSI
ncbi:MAG TPA: type I DNA topoisomerase [Oligoflexus sp.]|uniref:type I DNA topoisomerase n=1 Tax=Oligoflexus sp. TaxID=1971216 RepID=UPI002D7E3E83|nr:type I DNA topoisomerase [Oligoflexus sp.]HET9239187.1 type I DNA topoisomerase [Oligoflexus sp.]